jgi:DNA repair protein RecO (recombination protein O)
MYRTEGIVLAVQKKSDTTSLVHIYTREYGRIPYIVYGRKGTGKNRLSGVPMNILTPLSWLDIEGTELKGKEVHSLSSAQLHYASHRISEDVRRQCLAMFIAEALYKTLKHPLSDERVFSYLCKQIIELDTSDSIAHIEDKFMRRLSELLGYGGEPLEELQNLHSATLLGMLADY